MSAAGALRYARRPEQEDPAIDASSPRPLTVLLVEDDDADAQLARRALFRSGLVDARLVRADRMSDIRAHIEPAAPDLVLLDLTLPDSTGLDTLNGAVGLFDGTPIIVLTSIDDERLGIEALRAGAEDYVRKGTVDMDRLDRTVRYALERHIFRTRENPDDLYHANTGLPGRSIFVDRLMMALRRADAGGGRVLVGMLRCDALSTVADRHGQLAADVFERALVKRLAHALALTDSLALLGGGEYGCIVEAPAEGEPGEALRATLARVAAEPIRLPTLQSGVVELAPRPLRVGLASYPHNGRSIQLLLGAALSDMAPVG